MEGVSLVATSRRAFALVFLLHLGVQGLALTRVPERWVRPHTRFEVTAVAMSLYEKGAFADPYCLPTGPTAHMPPFHPALMAATYALLGPTLAAGYAIRVFLIACYGVMYGMLPWLGERLGLGAADRTARGAVLARPAGRSPARDRHDHPDAPGTGRGLAGPARHERAAASRPPDPARDVPARLPRGRVRAPPPAACRRPPPAPRGRRARAGKIPPVMRLTTRAFLLITQGDILHQQLTREPAPQAARRQRAVRSSGLRLWRTPRPLRRTSSPASMGCSRARSRAAGTPAWSRGSRSFSTLPSTSRITPESRQAASSGVATVPLEVTSRS
jgi:hypothetical protein